MRIGACALALLGACNATDGPLPPPPAPVTSVSFNIAGETIVDPVSGPAIADQLAALQPDFAELQECACDHLLERLPDKYRLVTGAAASEIGIVYDAERWQQLDEGTIDLGNDDNWGDRIVRWAKLGYRGTDAGLYVYATHFCVPIRPAEDRCDTDRQIAHARKIVDHINSHDAVAVVGGDFNVFDGFEAGPVIRLFTDQGLVDTLREVTAEPVTTFEGNSWAPAGRIDYVFATAPARVLAASVAEASASDHRPVAATIAFE